MSCQKTVVRDQSILKSSQETKIDMEIWICPGLKARFIIYLAGSLKTSYVTKITYYKSDILIKR